MDLVVRTLQESWDGDENVGLSEDLDPTPLAEDDVNMMVMWDDFMMIDDLGPVEIDDIVGFEWTD